MSDLIAIICAFGMSFCAFALGFGVGIKIGWKAKEFSLSKKE